ncbi:hypothetical protein MHYP_G00263950 [Metynnis hypsauchen]
MFIKWGAVIWALMLFWDTVNAVGEKPRDSWNNGLSATPVYTREYLLGLQQMNKTAPKFLTRYPEIACFAQGTDDFKRKRKKRGSRGGIRNRLKRRGSRFPLPTIALSNVRSVQNKMTELATLVKYDRDFSKANLICFTETWLTEDVTNIELEGYSLIRYDRDPIRTAKRTGGGLCMFINKSWATNFTAEYSRSGVRAWPRLCISS